MWPNWYTDFKYHKVILLTLVRLITCFRISETDIGDLMSDHSMFNAANVIIGDEDNINTLIKSHEHIRSIKEDENEIFKTPSLMVDNLLKDDMMAVSTLPVTIRDKSTLPVTIRNKRSKDSKHNSKKTSKKKNFKRNIVSRNTKEELSDILGEIRDARHRKLTRHDIRELAKRAFEHFKTQKDEGDKKHVIAKPKAEKATSASTEIKSTVVETKKEPEKTEQVVKVVKKSETVVPTIENINEDISNTLKAKATTEAEKELDSIFTEPEMKTKKSDVSAEDILKTINKKPGISLFSDESMGSLKDTKKSSGPHINTVNAKSTVLHSSAVNDKNEKSSSSTVKEKSNGDHSSTVNEKSVSTENNKSTSKSSVQSEKDVSKPKSVHKEKDSQKSSVTSKKDDVITDADKKEKIKTLTALLEKAKPNKVPKKFLPEFPSGLKMIAWRDLLEKKKKELTKLKSTVDHADTKVKTVSADHPVTINIEINKDASKGENVKSKSIHEQKESVPSSVKSHTPAETKIPAESDADHIKYLKKHLAGAQSLRKLIARALVGHCHATGRRILQAFIAMDKALARAQTIATIIGMKFHIDTEKIEGLVGGKEDEVVETFLKDIFSKFN